MRLNPENTAGRIVFGEKVMDYERAMVGLGWIARQQKIHYEQGGGKYCSERLRFLYDRITSTTPGVFPHVPLRNRLVPLFEEDVLFLGKHNSFRLAGKEPLLNPIIKGVSVNTDSAFCNVYAASNRLDVWDLCPDGDEQKPGMHLVTIRRHQTEQVVDPRLESWASWAIGWISDQEFHDLVDFRK